MSLPINLDKFKNILPKEVLSFATQLCEWGFGLTLVGGAVRDFALYDTLSTDLDFEVRSFSKIADQDWDATFRELTNKIEHLENVKVDKLRFNIIRVKLPTVELEISSPRIEVYDLSKKEFGHSDFEVKFSSNFKYSESFLRRDFSINAMGIAWSPEAELSFIDPFDGLSAIEKKELDYLSEDFFKDPVRFLRTLRFKVAHKLTLSRRLKDNLVYFNLEKLSLHYLIQEGKKIGIEKLILEIEFSRRKFAVLLPLWARDFNKLDVSTYPVCNELIEILLNYSIQDKVTDEDLALCGKQFLIKQATVKKIISLRYFKGFDFKKYKEELSIMTFEDVLSDERFLKLSRIFKGFYQIEENIRNFYIRDIDLKLFSTPILKDDLYKKLLPTIKHEHISMLGIYCHIIKSY